MNPTMHYKYPVTSELGDSKDGPQMGVEGVDTK